MSIEKKSLINNMTATKKAIIASGATTPLASKSVAVASKQMSKNIRVSKNMQLSKQVQLSKVSLSKNVKLSKMSLSKGVKLSKAAK